MKLLLPILLLSLCTQAQFRIPAHIEAENAYYFKGTTDTVSAVHSILIRANDWAGYSVDVPLSGYYTVTLQVANSNSLAGCLVKTANGATVGTVSIGVVQGWTAVKTDVLLLAGRQTLWLLGNSGQFKLDYLEVVPAAATISSLQEQVNRLNHSVDSLKAVLTKNVLRFDTMFDWTTTDTTDPSRSITIPSLKNAP